MVALFGWELLTIASLLEMAITSGQVAIPCSLSTGSLPESFAGSQVLVQAPVL